MNITAPEIPGFESYAVTIGEGQEEYIPLPAIRLPNGDVVTRWSPTEHERARLRAGEDVYVTIKTFGNALQPQRVTIGAPVLELPVPPQTITLRAETAAGAASSTLTCETCDDTNFAESTNDLRDVVKIMVAHAMEHGMEQPRAFSSETENGKITMRLAARADIAAYLERSVD